ncbi:MAG: hypothetical protein DMF62_08425 [Acidobacteria bacterium]|nr:MAG: hypothetical protein DMF62_08425 [Acidobacteriota bacterium]
MKRFGFISVVLLSSAILLFLPTFAAAQAKKANPKITYYSIKPGTVVRARLDQHLSSKNSYVGQTFKNTTVDPIYSSGGVLLIPQGSTIHGRISAVKGARKNGEPGTIDVTFTSITLPNGRKVPITGSLGESGKGDKNEVDNEGTVSANKTKNRNLKFIGGGAAGGAVIGGIAGGPAGALIGAGVGAVAGLIGKNQLKGKEAEVESGTEFGVYINRAITLPRYKEAPATP